MIDPARYGVSFSIKQCRNFRIDPHDTLDWLLALGWRRFRLMSYWDEHEKRPGEYDFTALDAQVATIREVGGEISLCLGAKQPRWPEYHWPKWTWEADRQTRDTALLRYVEQVVQRYASEPAITSWQLENEALLSNFGQNIEIDRKRLRQEFDLVRRLDPTRPVAMSTSNGWGIPVRKPIPDIVGFSYYPVMYKNGAYHTTVQKPWLHRLRTSFVHVLLGKPVFIHELQCEPWGHTAIWKMTAAEQDRSMSTKQIARNFVLAKKTKLRPIDLWGAEWWYWRAVHGDESIWEAVNKSII